MMKKVLKLEGTSLSSKGVPWRGFVCSWQERGRKLRLQDKRAESQVKPSGFPLHTNCGGNVRTQMCQGDVMIRPMDGSKSNVHLHGVQIEQVQGFKYLGWLVQEEKVESVTTVHSRTGQVPVAFA